MSDDKRWCPLCQEPCTSWRAGWTAVFASACAACMLVYVVAALAGVVP